MDEIHTQGILIAETLQEKLMSHKNFWLVATHFGDPNAAFFLVFPFTYFISKRTGVTVLWVAALSEWLNLVFKWMLFGERPYWWIKESHLFVNNKPKVHQFPATCETGPGSPSGHAMVTGAVWWVVVSSLGSYLYTRTQSVALSALPYLFYVLLLMVVGISRIFILAHFPHQVVAGSITGLILGVTLSHRVPHGRPLLFYFTSSMGLLISALVFYAGLKHIGIDLNWSTVFAKKWCKRAEWIRMDSTPFSSLSRDCGIILGLGLAQYWKPGGWSLPWTPRALCVAFLSMALYFMNRLPLPIRPPVLFYVLYFIKFALVPQIVTVLVPGLVHLLTRKKRND